MLFAQKTPALKRAEFRAALRSGKLLRLPGAFSPLVAMLIQRQKFEGVYISGAVLANDLGLPDVGLTTLTEVAQRGRAIARATELPAIIDADTGFGEPMNAARTVQELEEFGLCGCHFEDQQNPKRCGHLDGKILVPAADMVKKIRAAVSARRDPDFVVIARTDARASEGVDGAIARAKAYVEAGADMIFPEALADESEFEKFRKAISVPLLANMTEFGKRLAMRAVEDGLAVLKQEGSQEQLLDQMQTRAALYELLRYDDYQQFDRDVFDF
ncbi:MAG: isocitrate lyase/phosphoenolpyruvate mutase family protein [Verrucomicrobia bacterium]|nr:isocitrate lyase/phosphoenolpyruvate mutase family protein [Verrucomicrobiota bacterium]